MAPPPDHIYFPPLEELLEGETVLISWKLVASTLADDASDRLTSGAVTEFLSDPFVWDLLRSPGKAFERSTAQTAAMLNTKTAAINVTPTPNDKYNIKAIKADAAWLSKAAGINEVAALRLVVIELQTRPEAYLATPLSSQDATNIQKAAAGGATGTLAPATLDAEDLWNEFGTQDSQRRRLLATYLSERRYMAMSADYITSLVAHGVPAAAETAALTAAFQDLRSSLAQGLYGTPRGAELDPQALLPSVTTYIGELEACMERADRGMEAVVKEAGPAIAEDVAPEWSQTALTEAVHYMSVIFLALQSAGPQFLPPKIVQVWFRFVSNCRFMDGLTPGDDAMGELILPLKTLTCVNSLTLLNLNRAIAYLDHDLDLENEEEPYVNDSDVLEAVHEAILGAADELLPTASPVFLSWSLILHRMNVSYQERAERRDLTQNQRAQDGFELDNQPASAAAHALQPRGRRSSVGSIVSIEAARYDAFLSERVLTQQGEGEAMVPRLAMAAMDQCQVYDVITAMATSAGRGAEAALRRELGARVRLVFLEVLKASFPILGYQSDPLSALVAVLSGGDEAWQVDDRNDKDDNGLVAAAVLQDSQLMQFYVLNALRRFPFEFTPFVVLGRLLLAGEKQEDNEVVMNLLLQTPSVTFHLPRNFGGYSMIDEDEHATATMQITEDIPLFPLGMSRRRLAYRGQESASSTAVAALGTGAVIPAGTYGRFMIDGSGIVNLDYEHSTVSLLGKWLDASLAEQLCEPALGYMQQADAAEALRLVVAVVRSETRRGGVEGGVAVLQEASRDLEEAKDIVSVVCDTLDMLMQDGPAETDEARMAVLAQCMEFLVAALPLCPGRVWSYMARCQLLNSAARAGRLCILTSASDVVGERFHFLMASIQFLAALVNGAVSSAVQRKGVAFQNNNSNGNNSGRRPSGRDTSMDDSSMWLGASDKTLAQVCLAVAQTVMDVYENTSTWKFAGEVQRSGLVTGTVGVLRDIVVYASKVEVEGTDNPVAALEAAASFVTSSLLAGSGSTEAGSLRFQPVLTTLLLALEVPCSTLYGGRRVLVVQRTAAVLELAASLLGGKRGPTAALEAQIFQVASLPARLCASATLKQPALELLTDLVVSAAETAATAGSEPPSLLGYLGPHVSRAFLGVLAAMDKPYGRADETARVWRFYSTILRHRQQWMASCLLTGKTPREALRGTTTTTTKTQETTSTVNTLFSVRESALGRAKEALRAVGERPREEALALLDFYAAAQNYWPWTISSQRGDSDELLDGLRAFVRGLAPSAVTAKTDGDAAYGEARMAAYVAEILAMQLYHMRQGGGSSESLARAVVQGDGADLDYFLRDGVTVGGYNASLHGNFQRNFAQRYAGVTPLQFKRSLSLQQQQPHSLGEGFFYALDLADRMLAFDGAWAGPRGFRHEMQTANRNLSLVDAQIALFHAWQVLLLELSACLLPATKRLTDNHDASVQRLSVVMLQVAEQCLAANSEEASGGGGGGGELRVFARIAQGRANLALLLLQRLAQHGLLPRDASALLLAVWTAIHGVSTPWAAETAPYYRTLLRILYVVLQGTRGGEETATTSTTSTQTVLNVLDRVVASGFRTLVGLAHDPSNSSNGNEATTRPEDLALLTAVLQACLGAPGMSQCHVQVLNIMAAHDVLHVAVSLFSWSDRLVVPADTETGSSSRDPVYGELSLLFLLELSALPPIAEQMACDGLLGHLSSAALAGHMRRPGVSPFADSAGAQRCYSIWAKALLPLLINLLIALGTSIAPEIAYVLNQFPSLLDASVQRFEVPDRTAASALPALSSRLTLLAVSELHSLALLTQVLAALRVNHARDVPPVRWEAAPVLESVDFWLSRPKLLRERLVPLGPREAEWRALEPVHKGPGWPAENRLEEKVFSLLDAVKIILSDDE